MCKVNLNIENNRAYLEINRPEALNALNFEILSELQQKVEQIKNYPQLSTLVLSGAGEKSFIAGADIKQMQEMNSAQALIYANTTKKLFLDIENLPQIIIAKIQGFALGGGLELALCADLIIASSNAKFGFPEVSLGIIPGFGGTQRLGRRIGVAKALEWIVTGEKYPAQEAFNCGLINKLVEPQELNAACDKMVQNICKNGPMAVRNAKKVIKSGYFMDFKTGSQMESESFAACFGTPETDEGLKAFLAKRSANFGSR